MPRQRQPADDPDPAAGGQDEPLIDRNLEVALLREQVTSVARDGRGRAVLLLGESGVGKSRLAAVAAGIAQEMGLQVMQAHCIGRGAEPLLPLKEALATHLGRAPERIRRTLVKASPSLLESVPFVGRFLGALGRGLADTKPFESPGLHGVYEELARVLVGLSERQGLCLIVEDLHAADQDTLYFLHYLLKKARHRRVLVVATIQEEQLPEAPALGDLLAQWTASGDAVLTVLPLERAHVGEYAHQMGGAGQPVDEALVDRLFRLTGGNPFFLKETVRLLGEASRGGAMPPLDEQIELPARAGTVLRARLDRVSPATRRFLDGAAIVLETAEDIAAIADVVDIAEDAALGALAEARGLHILNEGSSGEISFAHDLMHRAVYGALGFNARRRLHERAAAWSEQAGQMASASYHFERAGDADNLVRTALAAAAQAEKAGMYHSALLHYQRARPFMEIAELGPLLGRALIVLGEWQQVQELIDILPADDGRVRLLRSELRFVQGNFDAAAAEARAALGSDRVDQIEVLIRLADVALYVGDLVNAQAEGLRALEQARQSGTVSQQARCIGIIGAGAFFGGDIEAGEARYSEALGLVTSQPDDRRDRTIQAVLLGNLADVAEARQDWQQAEDLHGQALQLRREVADARGAVHSLHGLGRARLRLGTAASGMALIDEAEQLAIDLDERVERAKIAHTRSELCLEEGDCATAQELAYTALNAFVHSQTTYDVAHARLTVSDAARRCGNQHAAVLEGSQARAAIERHGFGLLRRFRPEPTFAWQERIAASLLAYTCGDALGLPWEGDPPSGATVEEMEALPARPGWSQGATSDDTALTQLVAEQLLARGDAVTAQDLLAELAEAAPTIQGLGPSTTRAITSYDETGALPTQGGATNGAAMRALPPGWMTLPDDAERRRKLTIELSRATHPAKEAQVAACVMATCASWAVEDASRALLLEVARDELATTASRLETPGAETAANVLAEVAAGRWAPPAGISLDPLETVAATLHCVLLAESLRDGLHRAIWLGGDTDTVAALVGGLLGARLGPAEVFAQLPWHNAVRLPAAGTVDRLAAGLVARRAGVA